ncbi:MAG: hypothetical protein ACRECX_08705 [Methyloceanibacter sp.]|uniref:hypothetical protein n=1 Tax=Methyloceanibacter sp. TaxID=1965321 RepID=UPI003D6C7E60
MPRFAPQIERSLAREVLFKCGTVDGSFTCQRSFDGGQSGKNRRPGRKTTPSEPSDGGPWQGDVQQEALPPVGPGTATQTPAALPTSCPENSELLGGHCIPYTQRCSTGIPPNAHPPQCQGAAEKQVCNFHADGSKDCCCRIYSQF